MYPKGGEKAMQTSRVLLNKIDSKYRSSYAHAYASHLNGVHLQLAPTPVPCAQL